MDQLENWNLRSPYNHRIFLANKQVADGALAIRLLPLTLTGCLGDFQINYSLQNLKSKIFFYYC